MAQAVTLLLFVLPGVLATLLHMGLRKRGKLLTRFGVFVIYSVIINLAIVGTKLLRGASAESLFLWFSPPLSFAFYLAAACAMAVVLPLGYVLIRDKRVAVLGEAHTQMTERPQTVSVKRVWHILIRMAAVLVAGILIGALLVTTVYLLPLDNIQQNVRKSAATVESEGSYPFLYSNWRSMRLDNFTDSIMLLMAAYQGDQGLIGDAMLSTYTRYVNCDPAEGLVKWSTGATDGMETHSYSRYWHGYLVWLKPLLEVMEYRQIRVLNTVLQLLLVLAAGTVMFVKGYKRLILPFLVMYLFLTPIALFNSFQYSWIFYVAVTASLVLMLRFEALKRRRSFYLLFMITGMATSYVDFLTYPLITLGVPLLIYLVLRERRTMMQGVTDVIAFALVWGIGYVGMWAGKWVLCTLLTDSNVLVSVRENIFSRMSFSYVEAALDYVEEDFNVIDIIKRNMEAYNQWLYMGPFLLCFFGYALCFGRERVCLRGGKLMVNTAWLTSAVIPLLLVALSPVAWFFVASNHTYIHYWYAHRTLAIAAFAVLAVFAQPLPGLNARGD